MPRMSLLELVYRYVLFNPHVTFEADIFDAQSRDESHDRRMPQVDRKCANKSPLVHRRAIAESDRGVCVGGGVWTPARTVREFISEFRGLSATAKQKIVLGHLKPG